MQKKVNEFYRSLIWNEEVSLAVLDTTALVNEAISRHDLSPVAAAALGRTMTAAAYLCGWLKSGESALSVTVNGGGAGGKICVSGDGALNLRGFVQNPRASLPPRDDGKLDVGGFVGRNGTLTVVRDDGEGLPFTGTSELVSGEIAEDFSAYFHVSEQRPTAIALGVKIGKDGGCLGAGGVFLQPLPGADEEKISMIEREIAKYGALSSMIEREIAKYGALSSVIEQGGAQSILRAFSVQRCDRREFYYRCRCSRERAEGLVLAMGRREAESLLAERGEISVHCDYCNTDYVIGKKRVAELFRGGERE